MATLDTERYRKLAFDYVPLPFRLAMILVVIDTEPNISNKFLQTQATVEFLGSIGTPVPGLVVYPIGIIEVVTAVTVVIGFYAGIPAAFAFVEFVFAIWIGGPNRRAVMFLTIAFVTLTMGTGRFSVRNYLVVPDVYNRFFGGPAREGEAAPGAD